MNEAIKALDRLCNMASGQSVQDFACAKTDYWTVKDAINNKWQPIDTAPMDGTVFMVYASDPPGAIYNFGYCEDDGRFIPCMGDGDFEPTHWMPLPAPPGEYE